MCGVQGLQELALSHLPTMPMCDLLLLPSSITQLEFKGHSSNPEASTFPWELQQLAGLLQLKLSNCAVPPAVLQSFPRLQKLHVERCDLLPSDDEENPDDFDSRGTAALLDVLQQLTCLQRLELSLDRLDTEATPSHLFAALTASSCLTALNLEPDCYIPLPKGAVQHMFGAGKQLPLLQRLAIFNYDDSNHPHGWPDDEWTIDGSDLHLIARCCPALQQLDIALNVNPDADLEGLLQLPQSCTRLNVGGAVFDDDAANLVVQLTQLQDLCWNKSPGFTGMFVCLNGGAATRACLWEVQCGVVGHFLGALRHEKPPTCHQHPGLLGSSMLCIAACLAGRLVPAGQPRLGSG